MCIVEEISKTRFKVTVADRTTTTHTVTVTPEYWQKVTGGSGHQRSSWRSLSSFSSNGGQTRLAAFELPILPSVMAVDLAEH